MDLSATGTVTHIDNGRVYAFGHPLLQPRAARSSRCARPYVYSGLPEPVPVLEDQLRPRTRWAPSSRTASPRWPACIGKSPRMIPVEVKIKTSRGQERLVLRSAWWRTSCSAPCSPTSRWPPCCRATSAPSAPRPSASTRPLSADRRRAKCDVRGPVHAGAAGRPGRRRMVAAPLAYLMTNDFRAREVEKARSSRSPPTRPIAERHPGPRWLRAHRGPCAQGSPPCPLKVQLRTLPRGDALARRSRSASRHRASGDLLTCSWPYAVRSLTAVEQREMRQQLRVHATSTKLIRAINGLRRNAATIYVPDDPAGRWRHRARRVHAVAASLRRPLRPRAGPTAVPSVIPMRGRGRWDFDLPPITPSPARGCSPSPSSVDH